MKFSILSKCVALIIIGLSSSNLYAQCHGYEVLEFGSGRIITDRIYYFGNRTGIRDLVEWENEKSNYLYNANFLENDLNNQKKGLSIRKLFNYDQAKSKLLSRDIDSIAYGIRYLGRYYSDSLILFSNAVFESKNSYIKLLYADYLKYTKSNDSKELLLTLLDDECVYVKLNAALSLSYLGEKEKSYNTLISLWELNDPHINLDKYNVFTTSMRIFNNSESIDFLKMLLVNENSYCALDAAVCLIQLGIIDDSVKQTLIKALDHDFTLIWVNAALLLNEFFPDYDLKSNLSERRDHSIGTKRRLFFAIMKFLYS